MGKYYTAEDSPLSKLLRAVKLEFGNTDTWRLLIL